VLQFNCRSVYNKELELWNSVDTYNSDGVIDTESYFKVDISNAEVLRDDLATFRRDTSVCVGVFICVENVTVSTELWIGDDFEMIGV
jgi:hypothetical protein